MCPQQRVEDGEAGFQMKEWEGDSQGSDRHHDPGDFDAGAGPDVPGHAEPIPLLTRLEVASSPVFAHGGLGPACARDTRQGSEGCGSIIRFAVDFPVGLGLQTQECGEAKPHKSSPLSAFGLPSWVWRPSLDEYPPLCRSSGYHQTPTVASSA